MFDSAATLIADWLPHIGLTVRIASLRLHLARIMLKRAASSFIFSTE